MIEMLELPSGETVRFVYLRKFPNLDDMIYLQSARSGLLDDSSITAQGYRNMAPHYARQLADAIASCGLAFDAVVVAPSQRQDVAPYIAEISDRMGLPDLSAGFARRGNVKAATAASVEEVVAEFGYQPNGAEANIRSLLIVDDSVATGKTISAMLYHLRKAGLSQDCDATVAAPAWIKQSSNSAPDHHP